MIKFASISPHPPLLLPGVGSSRDKEKVKKTLESLNTLSQKLARQKVDKIIISSPHRDWGFNVPLYFLASDLEAEVKKYLIGLESPRFYFEKGKEVASNLKADKDYALIASGDLSHRLKKEGPYGFHPDGPKFDKHLLGYLKEKEIEKILGLDEEFKEAGECGLRSFCFMLGILEEEGVSYEVEVLSYEGPFGVGYMVADFNLEY